MLSCYVVIIITTTVKLVKYFFISSVEIWNLLVSMTQNLLISCSQMAAPKDRSKQPSKGRNNNAKPSFKPRKVRPVLATPPDGGWGWVVVASSFFISVLVDGVCFSMGIFFNPFREYFQATNAETAWVGAALNGTYLTIGLLSSRSWKRLLRDPPAILAIVFWVVHQWCIL